jgi:hypothetical protein
MARHCFLVLIGLSSALYAQSPVPEPRPKPLIPGAAPVRSCESLATITLPNVTIDSTSIDASTGICLAGL